MIQIDFFLLIGIIVTIITMIFLFIFILEERLPCQAQSVWGWWRRKRRRRFFSLVFFLPKLFLLFLLLYAWTWKEEIDYKLFLVLGEAMCLSQNTGNDWNLRSHLFCFIFSMPQPKRGEIESSFGGKSITGEKKTITLLQARPPSVMVKRSCGVMITNIQHCSLLPSEMKFWSWNSNKRIRGRSRK